MVGEYSVMGIGKTAEQALKEAEGKLPFPISDIQRYKSYSSGPILELNGQEGYSATITYTLSPKGRRALEESGTDTDASKVERPAIRRRRGAGAGVGDLERVVGSFRF